MFYLKKPYLTPEFRNLKSLAVNIPAMIVPLMKRIKPRHVTDPGTKKTYLPPATALL